METINSDVLVVGAGLAGFTAAVRASEQGAKVILIDKSHGELGDGNILMASGSLRAGGKSPRTNSNELYDFVMAEGVGYPDLVRAWSETCNRAVDWLISSGVKVDESAPGRVWLDQSGEVSLAPVYKKDVGTRALAKLKERFVNLGGRYLNGVAAEKLSLENDCVCGVSGTKSGETVELRSRATILSTGGFSANKEMVKRYIGPHADECKLRGSKQDTGDGLRMAIAVGAKAVNLKYFYGHLISRKALVDDRFWPYPRLDSFVDEGILIDRNGSRFVDEGRGDVAVANELARSEDVTGAVLIFDQESWDAAKDDAFSNLVKTPAPNPWLMDNDGEIFSDDDNRRSGENHRLSNKRTSSYDDRRLQSRCRVGHLSFATGPANRQAEVAARAVLRLESRARHHLHHGWSLSERPRSSAECKGTTDFRSLRRGRRHRRTHGRLPRRLHRRLDASGGDGNLAGENAASARRCNLQLRRMTARFRSATENPPLP